MGRSSATIDEVVDLSSALEAAVCRIVEGKRPQVRLAIAVLLSGGHLLVEDVPGVGKTVLAKALARGVGGIFQRVQFTPDLLPGDITGSSVYVASEGRFEFHPGPVFAHVVLGDEVNRAGPRTQAALLECMEESQVTVDGVSRPLPRPFLVIATQNPLEMEGTYPLPEAQRDRFTARITLGYPSPEAELAMLHHHGSQDPLDDLGPVTEVETVERVIEAVRQVWADERLARYVVDLVGATRSHPDLRLGASPRAALHLLRVARARAAQSGRDHVVPDDVRELAVPVLAHRLLPSPQAVARRRTPEAVVADLLAQVPVPGGAAG